MHYTIVAQQSTKNTNCSKLYQVRLSLRCHSPVDLAHHMPVLVVDAAEEGIVVVVVVVDIAVVVVAFGGQVPVGSQRSWLCRGLSPELFLV